MIGWLICRLPKWMGGGHKRGKRLKEQTAMHREMGFQRFECPRCKGTWVRKVRNAAA